MCIQLREGNIPPLPPPSRASCAPKIGRRRRIGTGNRGTPAMTDPSLAETLEACTQRCRDMDAPLGDRLSAFADDVRRLSPDFAKIVDGMVNRLAQAGAGASAPSPGETMPSFVLPDENGRLLSLGQLL